MLNPSPRRMPSKDKIRQYWWKCLVELEKFICEDEVFEDDYCFACGFEAVTERSHILARCEGGSDEASNLHLLCSHCHKASELLSGERYWHWFEKRSIVDVAVQVYFSNGGTWEDLLARYCSVSGTPETP
ncbi:HNH endonuclease [bacterium]|nr:HNH endonuclease [bacterium]